MSGPGPKDPPFITRALDAVEAAIAPMAQDFVQPGLASVLAKAHAAEQAALDATHKREVEAVDALEGFVANVRSSLETLAGRFPSLVTDFRAALSRL